ncbi:hypothetical protein [Hymenobacter terrestris]|uniref:Uncharacterized protein n=1 Tax=Hymenobacter terrestris TaxID=2748310 RepID=A0ABX2Q077_9BACT|nr:hypothetical protein [Hymenobacter terrestris]NVO83687.1 hypothetical protein [Hymenobacter terrestris]
MKVLVFPALLAIAIITGPAKSGTSKSAPTAPNKPAPTASIASLKPENSAQNASASTAARPKSALGLQPGSSQ